MTRRCVGARAPALRPALSRIGAPMHAAAALPGFVSAPATSCVAPMRFATVPTFDDAGIVLPAALFGGVASRAVERRSRR